MLEASMQEGIECRVDLRGDATPAAVEAMLHWMYTSEPPVLSLAEQYQMSKLSVACAEMMLDGMQPTNAPETLRAVWVYREQPHLGEVWVGIRAKFWQCCATCPDLQLSMEELVALAPANSEV